MSLRSDIGPALTGVWLVVSAVLCAAAIAPFALPPGALYSTFDQCAAQARGSSCPLCGMTTAYIRIARADFTGAMDSNPGSVPLWTASLVNFPAAVAYSLAKLRRRHRLQGERPCN